jgi:hypothetical protein
MSLQDEKKVDGDFGQEGMFKPGQNGDLEGLRHDSTTMFNGRKMSRIGPPPKGSIPITSADDASSGANIEFNKLVEMEASDAIKYRTCSWQKTAALLFSEYICLAIMSFPYSYSILGLVPGLILTAVMAGFVLYTSLIVWQVWNPCCQ